MRREAWGLALILLFTPVALQAQQAPIDQARAAAYFSEIDALVEADGGRLWGRPLGGPIMIVDPATRYVAANTGDTQGILRPAGPIFVGTLPKSLNVANTAVGWDDRTWTMVMWPPGKTTYQRRRLFAHELMHRLQHEAAWKTSDVPNAHLSTEGGRTWMRLELRALAAAVTQTGEARTRALTDALAFRAQRRSEFRDAAEQERMLELVEGTAEYTGFRLSGLAQAELQDSVAAQLLAFEGKDSFSRSFAYGTGPAYGLLLDAAGVQWRGSGSALDMSETARRAYGIDSAGFADARRHAERYDGVGVMAEESSRATRTAERVRDLRARFVEGRLVRVLPNSAFSMSFDPNGAEPLDTLGTVYPSARISDVWGVLTVESGGALFLSSQPGMYTGVVVPAPIGTKAPITGAGWKLELAPGWVLRPDARTGDWIVAKSEVRRTP